MGADRLASNTACVEGQYAFGEARSDRLTRCGVSRLNDRPSNATVQMSQSASRMVQDRGLRKTLSKRPARAISIPAPRQGARCGNLRRADSENASIQSQESGFDKMPAKQNGQADATPKVGGGLVAKPSNTSPLPAKHDPQPNAASSSSTALAPAHYRITRPTKYRPELCQTLIDAAANGLTLGAACAVMGITPDTMNEWRRPPSRVFRSDHTREGYPAASLRVAVGQMSRTGGDSSRFNAIRFALINVAPRRLERKVHD